MGVLDYTFHLPRAYICQTNTKGGMPPPTLDKGLQPGIRTSIISTLGRKTSQPSSSSPSIHPPTISRAPSPQASLTTTTTPTHTNPRQKQKQTPNQSQQQQQCPS